MNPLASIPHGFREFILCKRCNHVFAYLSFTSVEGKGTILAWTFTTPYVRADSKIQVLEANSGLALLYSYIENQTTCCPECGTHPLSFRKVIAKVVTKKKTDWLTWLFGPSPLNADYEIEIQTTNNQEPEPGSEHFPNKE